jgi:O-acetyl-ADP-ribose deacetylase (regulator of RNase III)
MGATGTTGGIGWKRVSDWYKATSLSWTQTPSYGIRTIAFPAISTGAYRFPEERAAKIAAGEVKRYLKSHSDIEQVVFVCFGQRALKVYRKALCAWNEARGASG